MTDRHSHKFYTDYTFEDFLQDDFFIQSITNPDTESTRFWQKQLAENKINPEAFEEAKQFLLSIQEQTDKINLSDIQLSSVWNRIQQTNKKHTNPKRITLYKKLGITASIAAACIIGIVMFIYHTPDNFVPNFSEKLISYAENNDVQIDEFTETQLIISTEKIVEIIEKESVIEYDTAQIVISSQENVKKIPSDIHKLIVPKGRRSRLRLEDGTLVHVNAGTIVYYPTEFEDNKREIYLTGEAFFEVTPDPDRPFIVHTSQMDVHVLGTKFNIMAYDTDFQKQVILADGAVKVISKQNSNETLLNPSEMYEISEEGFEKVRLVDIDYFTSWVYGLYFFDDERMDIVMRKLSRYYGNNITFEPDIKTIICSGKLDLKDDLDEVMNGLTFTFPIKIVKEKENYHITKISSWN